MSYINSAMQDALVAIQSSISREEARTKTYAIFYEYKIAMSNAQFETIFEQLWSEHVTQAVYN